MVDEVKVCVDAKVNFFAEYFTVPENLRGELESFTADTTALGESCGGAAEFEEKFVSTGLSARFNAILPRCTPKARKMTKEEKQRSREITKDILRENKEEIVGDALARAANRVVRDANDEMITESRERMIADGTYADYTIMRNKVEAAGTIAVFFRNRFKNKGDK